MSDSEDISVAETSTLFDAPNPEERRRIRSSYRQLIEEAQAKRDDPSACTVDDLDKTLNEAKALYGSVKMPREAAYDSELLCIVSAIGKQKISLLQANICEFELMRYANKLTKFICAANLLGPSSSAAVSDSEEDESNDETLSVEQQPTSVKYPTQSQWVKFGRVAAGLFRNVPRFQYMYGAFNVEPAEFAARAERRTANRQSQGVSLLVTVQEVHRSEENDEQQEATSSRVETVRLILRKKTQECDGPVNYFKFVVDPTSFGRTVENIFHCSFLIKDGYAELLLDQSGLPVIQYRERRDDNTTLTQQGGDRLQHVVSMNMDLWNELIEVFQIKEAVINDAEIEAINKKKKHKKRH